MPPAATYGGQQTATACSMEETIGPLPTGADRVCTTRSIKFARLQPGRSRSWHNEGLEDCYVPTLRASLVERRIKQDTTPLIRILCSFLSQHCNATRASLNTG